MKTVYIDTETTGLGYHREDLPFSVGILTSLKSLKSQYYEWRVDPFTRLCKPSKKDLDKIREVTMDESIVKVFHNAKFDIFMLQKIGVEVRGRVEDTSFAARVTSTLEMSYGLKPLTKKYFGFPDDDLTLLKQWVRKARTYGKLKGWKLAEDVEADYWMVQHVREFAPQLTDSEFEAIQETVKEYCVNDVVRTALLWKKRLLPLLEEDEHYRQTYEFELGLLRGPIMAMERRGIAVNSEELTRLLKKAKRSEKEHKQNLIRMAKEAGMTGFNPGSSPDLEKLLYRPLGKGGLGLKCDRLTNTGKKSVAWQALRPHFSHPFVRELMSWRSASKGISTFFQKYEDFKRPDPETPNGFILQCSLNQMGTITGRFSSDNPNLQQVANASTNARGTDPIQARTPFGPRPGYVWYTADYAQMELRVFADVASVDTLLDAILNGRDPNTENANKAWGGKGNPYALEAAAYALELGNSEPSSDAIKSVWEELGWNEDKASRLGVRSSKAFEVAEDWMVKFNYDIVAAEKSLGKSGTRGRSKIVTFAKIYGGGPGAVVDLLYCSPQEAQAYWRQYDEAFPQIAEYMKETSSKAAKDGYIITKYGRKLAIDPYFSYRAVNYMIQGTCADLMKTGISRTYKFIKGLGIDGHQNLTIHDELIFEIRQGHNYKWVLKRLCEIMSDHEGRLKVPMPVEMKRCRKSWSEKESVHF